MAIIKSINIQLHDRSLNEKVLRDSEQQNSDFNIYVVARGQQKLL